MRKLTDTPIPGVIIDDESKISAVLIPIITIDGERHLLFERRSMKLAGQPGDVCFPGGMVEEGETALDAAIRECCEELLINNSQIHIIGPAKVFHNMSLVTYPFVAEIEGYEGKFNTDEVSEVFTVPVDFFLKTIPEKHPLEWVRLNSDSFPYERIQGGKNYRWRKQINNELFYDWHGTTIWGFTAKMIYYAFKPFAEEKLFPKRYDRNGIISADEQSVLASKTALVMGCGGLGCYVVEMFARLGIGRIIAFDIDTFDESNLNRQLYCTEKNIGLSKAYEAQARVREINSSVNVEAFAGKVDYDLILDKVGQADLVIDCLDSVAGRLTLEEFCEKKNVPMVHGAIGAWQAQITTVYPGDKTLSKLYGSSEEKVLKSNPSFTPAFAASLEASEALKVLLGREGTLRNKLLIADLESNSFDIVELPNLEN